MKLEDVTMQDLISKPLFWEDFEEDRADSNTMKAAIEADPKSIEKIRFLDQVEEGTLLDRRTFHKLDFYEVEFTEVRRPLTLQKASTWRMAFTGATWWTISKSQSGLRLSDPGCLGSSGRDAIVALYLKDYEFGLINPLGLCVYPFDFDDDSWSLYKKEDPEKFILEHVLLHFETEFWDNDFDLKQEPFDYYHNMPDVHGLF